MFFKGWLLEELTPVDSAFPLALKRQFVELLWLDWGLLAPLRGPSRLGTSNFRLRDLAVFELPSSNVVCCLKAGEEHAAK